LYTPKLQINFFNNNNNNNNNIDYEKFFKLLDNDYTNNKFIKTIYTNLNNFEIFERFEKNSSEKKIQSKFLDFFSYDLFNGKIINVGSEEEMFNQIYKEIEIPKFRPDLFVNDDDTILYSHETKKEDVNFFMSFDFFKLLFGSKIIIKNLINRFAKNSDETKLNKLEVYSSFLSGNTVYIIKVKSNVKINYNFDENNQIKDVTRGYKFYIVDNFQIKSNKDIFKFFYYFYNGVIKLKKMKDDFRSDITSATTCTETPLIVNNIYKIDEEIYKKYKNFKNLFYNETNFIKIINEHEKSILQTLWNKNVKFIITGEIKVINNDNILFMKILDKIELKKIKNPKKFILQIIEGIKQIHNCNIIHNDIKKSNILLDNNNEPVIIDFGVSFNFFSKNKEKFFKYGSSYYRPFEKTGNRCISDYSSDIYSLGILILEFYLKDNLNNYLENCEKEDYWFFLQDLIDCLYNNDLVQLIVSMTRIKEEVRIDINEVYDKFSKIDEKFFSNEYNTFFIKGNFKIDEEESFLEIHNQNVLLKRNINSTFYFFFIF